MKCSVDPIPFEHRVAMFRMAYEHLSYAIAIDPIHYDSYYALSSVRGMISENIEFLKRTQALTERALRFRIEVLVPLDRIDQGGRDAELFVTLGEGFETIGLFDYAVFAYRCAGFQGADDSEIGPRIDKLIAEHFRAPSR